MRNFKALGLALVAVLAMSAVAASAAHGQNKTLTATGQTATNVLGHELGNEGVGKFNAFTLDGSEFTCPGSTFDVTGSITTGGVHEIRATPTYTGCKNKDGFPVTVTHNECEFRFYHLTASGAHFTTTVEVVCPLNKQIQVHVYSNAAHTSHLCTYDIPGQTLGGTFTVTNEPAGGVVLEGTIEGITSTRTSGTICGFGTHNHFSGAAGGVYHANVTLTGQNPAGEAVPLHVG